MRRTTIVQAGLFLLPGLLMLVSACSNNPFLNTATTGRTGTAAVQASPATQSRDAKLLADLVPLPVGQRASIGNRLVEAGPYYAAASGNECRPVHFLGSGGQVMASRLVCRKDNLQFFAADVFLPGSGPASRP